MTRDEFKLQRLKDDAAMNRHTYPILLGCVIGFVVLSIYAFIAGKAPAGIGGICIMASIALRLPLMRQQIADADEAIREFEAHLADPSLSLSESTQAAIDASDYPPIELLKGWIGLGIIAIMLLAMGILFGIISEGEQVWLIALSAGSIIGAIIVLFPTARIYRSWKTSKELERAGL